VATAETNGEAHAFLAMARKLRYALMQRDEGVRPYQARFDRAQDDLRMSSEKRAEIAAAFLRASYRADHVYEDCINDAIEDYLESTQGEAARS
jgi:hypothetical protein